MMEGFNNEVSLNDLPNYIKEENEAKRKKVIKVTLIVGGLVLLLSAIGVLVYFLVIKKGRSSPSEPKVLFRDADLVKSLVDERKIEIIQLENGLNATLISDPSFVMAGASLGVNVGASSDGGVDGLAHFAEHAMFLGSQKYQSTSTFVDHLMKYKGNRNAMTTTLNTVYYFNILQSGYEQCLDIFARMFNETLLPLQYVGKEINAINSEFLRNNGSDGRRKNFISGTFFGEGFSTGNLDTLGKMPTQELLDKVKVFIGKYYYATNMDLALYSNESIKELKAKAVKYFSTITNKTTLKQEKANKEESEANAVVTFHTFGHIGWFKSLDENYKLNFIFPVRHQPFKTDLLQFLKYLVEDQEPGSFIHEFKQSNHLISATFNVNRESTNYVGVEVELTLKKEGMDILDHLIRGFFTYINTLKQSISSLKPVFDESNKMANQMFNFTAPPNIIQNVAMEMIRMKGDFRYLFHLFPSSQASFSETYIKKIFDYFVPDNCLILIETHMNLLDNIIKEYTEDPMMFFSTVKYSSHYNTRHNIAKLRKQYITELTNSVAPERFKVRKTNPFVSNETALIPCNDKPDICKKEKEETKAEKIVQRESSFIYYRLDRSFKVPKTFASFRILHPGLRTPLPDVFNQSLLFYSFYEDTINSKLKSAVVSGNSINVNSNENGIEIQLYAYNDVFPSIVKALFNLLRSPKLTQPDFSKYSQMTKAYKSQLDNEFPYLKAMKIANALRKVNAKLSAIQDTSVTLEQLNAIYQDYPNHYIIDGIITGALSKESILKVYVDSIKPLEHSSNKIAKELNGTTTQDVLNVMNSLLTPNGSYVYRSRPSKTEQNHAIVNLYYICQASDKLKAAKGSLLQLAFGNIFFDILRTQLQLGYIAREELLTQSDKMFFRVHVQGPVEDPLSMNKRIDDVFRELKVKLSKMTTETLNQLKSVLSIKLPWTVETKMSFLIGETFKRTLTTVDSNDALIEGITVKDLLELFDEVTASKVAKLSVQLYNSTSSIDIPMVKEPYALNSSITSIVSSDLDMLKK